MGVRRGAEGLQPDEEEWRNLRLKRVSKSGLTAMGLGGGSRTLPGAPMCEAGNIEWEWAAAKPPGIQRDCQKVGSTYCLSPTHLPQTVTCLLIRRQAWSLWGVTVGYLQARAGESLASLKSQGLG